MNTEDLAAIVDGMLPETPPYLVGVGGAVSVGKSTLAASLAEIFRARGRPVHVLATDAFLYPNAVLEARGLTMRKGFPESYDLDAAATALRELKAAEWPVRVPMYSHATYDILPEGFEVIDHAELVLIDGVVALQDPLGELLDVAIYIEADEAHVRSWFSERFAVLTDAARDDPTSFYRLFVDMDEAGVRGMAAQVWDGINGPNLRDHIEPSRRNATLVVRKAADHTIVAADVVPT
jgi:type I pantothenate kinase